MITNVSSANKKNDFVVPNSIQKLISQVQNSKRGKKLKNTLPIKRNLNKSILEYKKADHEENNQAINRKLDFSSEDELETIHEGSKNQDGESSQLPHAPHGTSEFHKNESTSCDVSTINLTEKKLSPKILVDYSNDDSHFIDYEHGNINKEYTGSLMKEKHFLYPTPQQGPVIGSIETERNNYVTNSELGNFRKNENSDNYAKSKNTSASTFQDEKGIKSLMKVQGSAATIGSKKWVTFNDIVEQNKFQNSSFVDDLYGDDNPHENNSKRMKIASREISTDTSIHNHKQVNPAIELNPEEDNSQIANSAIERTTEKLRDIIQQVRQMNEVVLKAKQEIQKFRYTRKH